MTRMELAKKTVRLSMEDPVAFVAVSVRTLERIERGASRPRLRAAAALAEALFLNPAEVFPLGPDDGVRNPEGKTAIPPNRRTRGEGKRKKP